jgi:hypothetical protein
VVRTGKERVCDLVSDAEALSSRSSLCGDLDDEVYAIPPDAGVVLEDYLLDADDVAIGTDHLQVDRDLGT